MDCGREVDHEDLPANEQNVGPPLQVEVYPPALVELFDDILELANNAGTDLAPDNVAEISALEVLDGD